MYFRWRRYSTSVSTTQITRMFVTFCQDGSVSCAIVRATRTPMATIARTNASALIMRPATRKTVR